MSNLNRKLAEDLKLARATATAAEKELASERAAVVKKTLGEKAKKAEGGKASEKASTMAETSEVDPHMPSIVLQKKGEHHRLVVCVLSSRSHKDRRDHIRNSWAKEAAESNALVLFAVGAHGCPPDQQDKWHCNITDPARLPDPVDEENLKLNKVGCPWTGHSEIVTEVLMSTPSRHY